MHAIHKSMLDINTNKKRSDKLLFYFTKYNYNSFPTQISDWFFYNYQY